VQYVTARIGTVGTMHARCYRIRVVILIVMVIVKYLSVAMKNVRVFIMDGRVHTYKVCM
jgi:hypothetical protein